MGQSRVQRIIENTLRAKERRDDTLHFGNSIVPSAVINYGIDYGTSRLNARLNSKSVVECGSCVAGWRPERDDDGKKTGRTLQCQNCQGIGVRYNRRFGRCGKTRAKFKVS